MSKKEFIGKSVVAILLTTGILLMLATPRYLTNPEPSKKAATSSVVNSIDAAQIDCRKQAGAKWQTEQGGGGWCQPAKPDPVTRCSNVIGEDGLPVEDRKAPPEICCLCLSPSNQPVSCRTGIPVADARPACLQNLAID